MVSVIVVQIVKIRNLTHLENGRNSLFFLETGSCDPDMVKRKRFNVFINIESEVEGE